MMKPAARPEHGAAPTHATNTATLKRARAVSGGTSMACRAAEPETERVPPARPKRGKGRIFPPPLLLIGIDHEYLIDISGAKVRPSPEAVCEIISTM